MIIFECLFWNMEFIANSLVYEENNMTNWLYRDHINAIIVIRHYFNTNHKLKKSNRHLLL